MCIHTHEYSCTRIREHYRPIPLLVFFAVPQHPACCCVKSTKYWPSHIPQQQLHSPLPAAVHMQSTKYMWRYWFAAAYPQQLRKNNNSSLQRGSCCYCCTACVLRAPLKINSILYAHGTEDKQTDEHTLVRWGYPYTAVECTSSARQTQHPPSCPTS